VKSNFIGIGEVLWDLLPGGRQLGGAPANFAYHAAALGADARVISRVGNDPLGKELIERIEKLGLPSDCIQVDSSAPTGTVTVEVAADGQPKFQIHERVAWDALADEPAAQTAVAAADVICFGSLAQRSEPSRSTIRSLIARTRPSAWRVFDINLRQHYYSRSLIEESLALANGLKVNDEELPRLADMLGLKGDIRSQISELATRFALRLVAYTRGGSGSLLHSDGNWSDHPGIAAKVVDAVGAGDSFTAAMMLGMLAGWSLDRINEQANRVAAYVCSQAGATPPIPPSLREVFRRD
jgi:fructokinase